MPSDPRILYTFASLAGGAAVLAWRVHETRAPVTARKILLPPLGMSTGFLMFLFPPMRIPWGWALGAFVLGSLLLARPLIRSSSLERVNGDVMLERSGGFFAILLGLLALRIVLHEYVEELLPPRQTAALFFVLAFGMILRWRAGMYLRYRRLTRSGRAGSEPEADPGISR